MSVTHACNPSCSGGKDQKDHSSKPARANNSRDPISKIPITKKGCLSGSRYRPCIQIPTQKKNGIYKKKDFEIILCGF
jgi:hypothetical protein